MTVFEVVLPSLKKDPAVLKEFAENIAPGFVGLLGEAGVRNGHRGYIVTEDGRDQKGEYRELLLLEWPDAKHFHDFVGSQSFADFQLKLKETVAAGPAVLKVFDPTDDDVSAVFRPASAVLEYLVVKPKDASPAGVQALLGKVQASLPRFGTAQVALGTSVNLEAQEIGLLSVYASDAELDAAKATAGRQQLLADIASEADVTSLVAQIEKVL
ncbi:hypothetical protein F5Y14DRAFT_455097 [Nemania sp. NC0429]|nr:hypothetical protein F5Y14DRAFT_455097 [Nemania sp. NC0429]